MLWNNLGNWFDVEPKKKRKRNVISHSQFAVEEWGTYQMSREVNFGKNFVQILKLFDKYKKNIEHLHKWQYLNFNIYKCLVREMPLTWVFSSDNWHKSIQTLDESIGECKMMVNDIHLTETTFNKRFFFFASFLVNINDITKMCQSFIKTDISKWIEGKPKKIKYINRNISPLFLLFHFAHFIRSKRKKKWAFIMYVIFFSSVEGKEKL